MEKGYVQIYTGDGKGKTTAAFGLALRAVGNDMKVMIVQFLKGRKTGEVEAMKKFEPKLTVYRAAESNKFSWDLTLPEKRALQKKVEMELADIIEGLELRLWDVLILDEVCGAITADIVREKDILHLLDVRPSSVEVVMTGRDPSEALMERADLITEMTCVKHYFNEDVEARKGIEF
jgi:cob(I)alamin adenosyltransferase